MTMYNVPSTYNERYIAVRAVNYELRVVRLDLRSGYGNGVTIRVYRYAPSTLSGGTVTAAVPMRQGAPAASAQARVGDVTASGTQAPLSLLAVPAPGPGSLDFPYDTTVAPGSAIVIDGGVHTDGNNYTTMHFLFEELRLSWSY